MKKDFNIAQVTSATKLLSSKDPNVQQIAISQLSESASKRKGISLCSSDDLDKFLNTKPESGKGKTGDIQNL